MVGTDDDPGIMVRALNDLFFSMEKTSDDMKYKVTMSYLEVCKSGLKNIEIKDSHFCVEYFNYFKSYLG